MSEPIEIPKSIDDPPTILLWRIDDLVPIVVCLIIGIFMGRPATLFGMLLIGVLLVRLYSKYRERRPDGHALHALYWWGLIPLKGRTTPNPFIRRWAP